MADRHPTAGVAPKATGIHAAPGTPAMDAVTVCDSAACAVWPDRPITTHRTFADPAVVEDTDFETEKASVQAFRQIHIRRAGFLDRTLHSLGALASTRGLDAIDRLDGASRRAIDVAL